MNTKLSIASIITTAALTGCATTTTIEEKAATAELQPMEKPALVAQRIHQIDKKNGEELYYERIDINADGSNTGRNSKGCSWEGNGDLIAPALSWKDCGSNPEWIKGENRNLTKKGEIWPLEVGNEVTYRYTQVNALGKEKGRKTRKCKVASQVNVDVASGNHDAFKVVCKRQDGDWSQTRVWYFSPATQSAVKFIRSSSSNGVESDHELVKTEAL